MTLPDGYRIIPLDDPTRLDDVLEVDTWAFPVEHGLDELRQLPSPLPWGRMWGIEAVERPAGSLAPANALAGMYGTYDLRAFPVPGGETACSWVTWVGVHPSHRRRGLLRSMIAHHFAEARERGEALSVLNAAEAGIYGRFGYRHAAPTLSLTVPRGAELRPVAGSDALRGEFLTWDPESHGDLVAELHRAAAQVPTGIGRPGWATWETPELRRAQDADPAILHRGKEALRLLVVSDASGRAQGYARFRRAVTWERATVDGTVEIRDLVGLTPAAVHRLWSLLLDLDLTSRATIDMIPVDDPIMHLLIDVRAAEPRLRDLVWVRILDLPAALAARRYAAPVDLVLDVRDELLPENAGRWRVTVTEAFGTASVERVDAGVGGAGGVAGADGAADLVLDIDTLGAAHLGSTSLAALALAGRVEAREPRVLAAAAVAWSWPIAAGADWEF
ncbi:GNAT family N-acetyltransferase [Leucobacter sp. OLJS4]|uniref:GNAT family N-acetyltransferase n=1 Tax=unclassified Leucobacter TaxID=2621730 RepID=UPI000C198540|nr:MULTISPECIES: GNAT family N-acetyltransferase [unclassified Leucobacter]PII84080.1 GNAT family N-acetyltransferase [Leucobacter sp. OLCALW19]PII88329.1 GNAT family N-acetyltransferase [Leucobacter sp. OLTLW20]PII92304.1 GNAT family N-acetyltransferase [Leucobacter sp. OLAS13]PII99713.1 GNAT family N-acetyltransferase [Leucobacter sp. OLDS2]PIJ02947.1 GNAT family N-acetyltransferase [Leucobacter sp. OLIS6]